MLEVRMIATVVLEVQMRATSLLAVQMIIVDVPEVQMIAAAAQKGHLIVMVLATAPLQLALQAPFQWLLPKRCRSPASPSSAVTV
jgi:hypothetical protein